eukprot:scaffold227_cov165-Amphora_coffeaeformis.AAC.17
MITISNDGVLTHNIYYGNHPRPSWLLLSEGRRFGEHRVWRQARLANSPCQQSSVGHIPVTFCRLFFVIPRDDDEKSSHETRVRRTSSSSCTSLTSFPA